MQRIKNLATSVVVTLLVAILIITCLLYLFNSNYTWVQLFAPLSQLLMGELHSIVFIYAGIIFVCLAYDFKCRKVLPGILLFPIVFISIGSWLNFEFYKDFLVFDSLLLLTEVGNGPPLSAFTLMESFSISIFFLLGSILFIGLIYILQSSPRLKLKINAGVLTVIAVMCFLHGITRVIWFYDEVGDISMVSPPNQVHPFNHFLRSVFTDFSSMEITKEHVGIFNSLDSRAISDDGISLSINKQFKAKDIVSDTENIIVIILESVRASETRYFGYDYGATPVLDSIAEEYLGFSNFYANSNQTVRAETSILCGVLDYSSGAPYSVRGLNLNIDCVPKILSKKGYQTLWFHGNDAWFFDRQNYLPQLGFETIYSKEQMQVSMPEVKDLGWGIPDEMMFKFAIEKLSNEQQPFFAEILTLSNHYPFNYDFPESIERYNESPPLFNDYLRSIRYTDFALGVFWEWFNKSPLKKNTAVFIVSDHGLLIMSDKQKQSNPYYQHEMQFKIPMVAVIPGLKAEVDTQGIYSQVDMPATIFDLLGVNLDSSYIMAGGIFDENKQSFALATGFSSYVVRLESQLCFPHASASQLISKTNNAYYDANDIGQYNIVCSPSNPNILKSFNNNETEYIPPNKNFKDLTRVIDKFLTTGFQKDAVEK